MVNIFNTYTSSLLSQEAYTNRAALLKDTTAQVDTTTQGYDVEDIISLSPEAKAMSQTQQFENELLNTKVSYYEQFRPTREGFSSRNMALGMVDPSAQPFSQDRPFAEVAQAARENLDSKYAQMRESGSPFDKNSYEGVDIYSLFGDLDRRALYAVASNEGDAFTKDEIQYARDIMRGQQGMAMGLYNGPTRLNGEFKQGFTPLSSSGHAARYKMGIEFMDLVSAEEKATDFEWASQRAFMQKAYESNMRESGEPPENLSTDHPLVNLILEALETADTKPLIRNDGNISSKEELLNEPWFKDYQNQLEDALAQTRALYKVITS